MTGPGGGAQLIETLAPMESDSLLALIALAKADPRDDKIDVGVGVFRDSAGRTPILRVVKAAEKLLWAAQETKSYLGGKGDVRYTELLRPIVLGRHAGDERIVGLQTPGGCGALKLGFELIAAANPAARVLVGTPTWPNHPALISGSRLKAVSYPYYEPGHGAIRFDAMMDAVRGARRGDVVLLHGCCHNPTGADLDAAQWAEVTSAVVAGGLIPLVDIAYQGLGRGLVEDAAGLWGIFDACDEVIVAHSCDKNFGLYRDRVGSLWIKTARRGASENALAHVLQIAREMWSMPPDHGAAVVRTVLDDEALRADWLVELDEMRARILTVRMALAAADPRLAFIANQHGMFSMLPLSVEQVRGLRASHGIYMADSGRFNIVGMADTAIDPFIAAVVGAMNG
ncbi:MAG: aromatic amino acid transaminase [Sphingomicrobium sp.]